MHCTEYKCGNILDAYLEIISIISIKFRRKKITSKWVNFFQQVIQKTTYDVFQT